MQSENGNNSDNCYLYSNTVKGYCDYTRIGIGSTYRGMIQETTWYIGAVSSQITSSSGDTHVAEYKMTAGEYYEAERKNGVATVRDYIGLMYPSDYGYSVLSSSCGRTMQVSSYNKNVCGGKSWIYGAGVEWTLMRDSYSTDGIYRISIEGYLSPNSASMGREVRPVLYLKPSVYVIEGNGKANNPYVIGM